MLFNEIMAWACTYAVQAEAVRKAGAYANATAIGAPYTLAWGQQAEGIINTLLNYNYSDIYAASMNEDKQGILVDAASNLVAIYILNYDLSSYPSRTAETMLDILWSGFWRDIKILQTSQASTFIQTNP